MLEFGAQRTTRLGDSLYQQNAIFMISPRPREVSQQYREENIESFFAGPSALHVNKY